MVSLPSKTGTFAHALGIGDFTAHRTRYACCIIGRRVARTCPSRPRICPPSRRTRRGRGRAPFLHCTTTHTDHRGRGPCRDGGSRGRAQPGLLRGSAWDRGGARAKLPWAKDWAPARWSGTGSGSARREPRCRSDRRPCLHTRPERERRRRKRGVRYASDSRLQPSCRVDLQVEVPRICGKPRGAESSWHVPARVQIVFLRVGSPSLCVRPEHVSPMAIPMAPLSRGELETTSRSSGDGTLAASDGIGFRCVR